MKGSTSTSVGLVIRRPPRQFAADAFYGELISGLDDALRDRGLRVLMHAVDGMPAELATYRRWVAGVNVRAVVLVDLVPDDPRPALLAELRLPAVVVGEPEPSVTTPSVRTDNYAAMREAVEQLAALGHRRIGHVTGITTLVHTRERARGFSDAIAELGLEALTEEGDYTQQSGERATDRLLATSAPPTAVIYDNDLMAVGGLGSARRQDVAVPSELSILAWDDSPLCRLSEPALSVMSHDARAHGVLAGRLLLDILDGTQPASVFAAAPVFVARGSITDETSMAEAS